MPDLSTIQRSDFEPFLNQEFRLVEGETIVVLELIKVLAGTPMGHGPFREPFSLEFKASPGPHLPQKIYRLENDTMGALELFLVPTGSDATGVYYYCVFN